MKYSLLLIDLQEDYLAAPGLEPHRMTVVAGAARLRHECRERGIQICHVWTTVHREPDDRMRHWKLADRWSCEAGTSGHATARGLEPLDGELVFQKNVFSAYSDPKFERQMESYKPDVVILAGVHTHACVRQTALDAFQRGMEVWVAAEAIGSPEPLHAAQTEIYLRRRAVAFLSTDEILNRLDGRQTAVDGHFTELPSVTLLDDAQLGRRGPMHFHFSPSERGGEPRWKCSWPTSEQIDTVVRAATAPGDGATWQAESAAVLEKAAELLLQTSQELASRLTADTGKPVRHAREEVERTAALFKAVARRTARGGRNVAESEATVARRSHGVIAAITPWNNPLAIFAGQFAPAFAYGNAVVWKPAPPGLSVAFDLRELLLAAGVPPGSLQIVSGYDEAGMELAGHPGVGAVCFTGSTHNGWKIVQICAAARKPLQGEFGGNNPAIIWLDAGDLDEVARSIAAAAFGFAGQRCTATRRVILPDSLFDRAFDALRKAAACVVWGDPGREETDCGPLISAAAVARVAGVVERARESGCMVVQPHLESQGDLQDAGAYYPPTLVVCDEADSEIVQEETFAPVLVVQRAKDWAQAMELANGVKQGLVAALFSSDPELQKRFLREANAGILKINQSTAGAGVDVPFGGWKLSGLGIPQHGRANLEFFTRMQTIYSEKVASLISPSGESSGYEQAAGELLGIPGVSPEAPAAPEVQEISVREPLRVSIVTPSYQQGRFLRQCIESVLAQDYPHIEYFVIDGGSTDGSRGILESYGDRFFWKSEPDGGQAAAINYGLRRAQGTILGYLNSDDLLLPGAVSSVVAEWGRKPDVDVFFGQAHYINETGKVIGDYDTREFDLEAFKEQCFICQPAAFWHRRVMEKIGLLDESYNTTMDYEYWQRLAAEQGVFVKLDQFLACSRDHATTKSRLQRSQLYSENFRSQWKHWGYISPQWWRGLIDYLKCERRVFWRPLIPSWKKSGPLSKFLSRHIRKSSLPDWMTNRER